MQVHTTVSIVDQYAGPIMEFAPLAEPLLYIRTGAGGGSLMVVQAIEKWADG
jgi:hypothetical protein